MTESQGHMVRPPTSIAQLKSMHTAGLHRIYRETMNRLDVLSRRVAEGRDVMAASEFARWLSFSGIIRLCEENACGGDLKVDGALLRWTCEQLIQQCNERIDLMAGYMSKLSVAPSVSVHTADGEQYSVDENLPVFRRALTS